MSVRHVSPAIGLALLVLGPLPASPARADDSYPAPLGEHFSIDEQDPEAHLPSAEELKRRPLDFGYLLMDLDDRSTAARERGQWGAALKFDRASAKLVPDKAVSFSALCRDYEMLNRREEALASCARALALPGAKIEDYARFIHLVGQRPGGVDKDELNDANEAISHLKSQPPTKLAAYELQCELSLRSKSSTALDECSQYLMEHAPDSARALAFSYAAAIERKNLVRARELIERAKAKRVAPDVIANMERGLRAASAANETSRSITPSSATRPLLMWLLTLGLVIVAAVVGARRLMKNA